MLVYSALQIFCLTFLDFAYLSWIHFVWTMGSIFIPSIIPLRMYYSCLNSSGPPTNSNISELLFLFFAISSVFNWTENYFCANGSFEYSLKFSITNLDDFFYWYCQLEVPMKFEILYRQAKNATLSIRIRLLNLNRNCDKLRVLHKLLPIIALSTDSFAKINFAHPPCLRYSLVKCPNFACLLFM